MQSGGQTKRWIQFGLALAIVAASVRLVLIYRHRHESLPEVSKPKTVPLNPTYYVVPKKLYAYDLKTARQLTKGPAWVREGYKHIYYPYDRARHRTDFRQEAGRLGPIERLQIKEVVLDSSPGSPDQHQIMAVFEKSGKSYAFPIGAERRGDYQIYIDEILYIEDPHQLYNFWPADVWHAIEHHEVKPGMDELQASFAAGVGLIENSPGKNEKVLRYPNDGHTLIVIFRDGKAVDVKSADAAPIPQRQV